MGYLEGVQQHLPEVQHLRAAVVHSATVSLIVSPCPFLGIVSLLSLCSPTPPPPSSRLACSRGGVCVRRHDNTELPVSVDFFGVCWFSFTRAPCTLWRGSGFAWPYALVSKPLGNATDPNEMAAVVNTTNALLTQLSHELNMPTTDFVGPTWLQGQGAVVNVCTHAPRLAADACGWTQLSCGVVKHAWMRVRGHAGLSYSEALQLLNQSDVSDLGLLSKYRNIVRANITLLRMVGDGASVHRDVIVVTPQARSAAPVSVVPIPSRRKL